MNITKSSLILCALRGPELALYFDQLGNSQFLGQIWKAEEIVPLFMMYSIVYLFSGILSQFHWMEQANFRFNGIFVTNFVKQGVFFIYLAVCFFFDIQVRLIELIYVQAIALFFAIVVEYFFVKDLLRFTFDLTSEWMKKLLNYGKYALWYFHWLYTFEYDRPDDAGFVAFSGGLREHSTLQSGL